MLASRRRRVLTILAILLALDVGRSIYARIGYARPVEVWQPDPAVYADLRWPPGSDLPPNTPPGRRVYMQRCAVCHGPDGRGNGPAAPSMIPRPRDFTKGQYKYRSTAEGQPPTDDDVLRVIASGLPASAMPYWKDVLSEPEMRAVAEYIKGFAPTFSAPREALSVPQRVPPDAASLRRGQPLYQQWCVTCHGDDGRAQQTLKDAKGYPVVTRDLSAPWTFRGGAQPEQIWLRLTTGMAPGPMPSFARVTTPQERWDLVNYTLSLARTPAWEPGGTLDGPGLDADLAKRGRYLVHAQMCGLCHTPINRTGIYRGDDFYLAGGMRVGTLPHGVAVSRNLTSDPETGLGRWTENQIAAALRTGRAPDRLLNFWDMPWQVFHSLSADDARAIARYLKTLPAVRNRIPATLRYGVVETIVAKFRYGLPVVNPRVLTFADGMFGQRQSRWPRDWPQRLLIVAQWLILIIGTIDWFFARPRSTGRGWLARVAVLVGIIALGVFGWVLYHIPMLRFIPPEQIAATANAADIPPVERAAFSDARQFVLAERGRYLFMTYCSLCHLPSGAGGAKISWKPMGSLWSRNITPDVETGIGRWTDAQISRAIRSGVAVDGRALHWQGMTWDHASNLDEVDVRALIVYLRALPPVKRAIPTATPPSPADCDVYTFWTSPSLRPGCR